MGILWMLMVIQFHAELPLNNRMYHAFPMAIYYQCPPVFKEKKVKKRKKNRG